VILEDLERLAASHQEELLRLLDGELGAEGADPAAARVVATTRIGLKRATEEGRLRDDLSQRLDRLQFRVPALRDRREDVLPLTECLSRRLAREERAPVPSFSDEALALLWRQPWDGNVRELETFVYKLVLLGTGDQRRAVQPIEPAQILEIARRFSLQLVQRLPSRHPSRWDLLAALRVTRKAGGRLNKTRAALYLGWDPDTLVARMQDAGIGEEIEGERAWATPPAPPDQESGEPAT
jgi:DNA-binding NtrC family response regulator